MGQNLPKTHIPLQSTAYDQTSQASARTIAAPIPRELVTVATSPVATAGTLVHGLTIGCVAFGVTLRIWQFLSAPSLFWGELALARNVEARGLMRLLTERTAFGQGTSPGYLVVQDLITTAFGSNEITQRLFAFISSILVLVMFLRVAGIYLSGSARLLGVACVSLGFPFLFLLSPFKALCSVDTAATLAMFLLAHKALDSSITAKSAWQVALGGFVLVWFAEAAVVMAAGLSVVLLGDAIIRRDSKRFSPMLVIVALWSVGAVGALVFDHLITDSSTRALLRSLYTGAEPPAFPDVSGQFAWLYQRITEALGATMFHLPLPAVVMAVMAAGLVTLRKIDPRLRALLVAPIVAALVAAAAGWYIFQVFYIAFLFPYLFVLFARGADWISSGIAALSRILSAKADGKFRVATTVRAMSMTAWLAFPVAGFAKFLPPFEIADTRAVLSYVSERRQANDRMYGITSTSHAIEYYGPKIGLNPTDFVIGGCHLGDPGKTLAELDQFRGQSRVWVFFTHDLAKYNVRGEALNYLNRIGTARDSIVLMPRSIPTFVPGASAYLYDLSDAEKLKAADAATVPLLREAVGTRNNGCGGGLYSAEVP